MNGIGRHYKMETSLCRCKFVLHSWFFNPFECCISAKAICVTYCMHLACRSSGSGIGEGTAEKKEPENTAGADQLHAVSQQYLQVCKFLRTVCI